MMMNLTFAYIMEPIQKVCVQSGCKIKPQQDQADKVYVSLSTEINNVHTKIITTHVHTQNFPLIFIQYLFANILKFQMLTLSRQVLIIILNGNLSNNLMTLEESENLS